MTGKELIIYILNNNLENEEIIENGRFKFLMSEEEAAVKFNVGLETIRIWQKLGRARGIMIGTTLFFPRSMKDPRVYFK